MIALKIRLFTILILCGIGSCKLPGHRPPNIIYILADDLGYGELGIYGQKIIETPNLDALGKSGIVFSQHYSGAPVCAPARCVLLTGAHPGHAYVRGNDEWGERGKVWDYNAMFEDPFLEGQRPLPDSIVTIAEVLQSAGYKTGMVGKWGLGAPTTEGTPNRQGFDFFYGYNCQRQAHTYYPLHLWRNEEKVLLQNKNVPIHANLPQGADPFDEDSYSDFTLEDYAPELMHREAIQFIQSNQDHPFFLYYASPIPHVPLQAPQKWVDYYREKLGAEEPFTGTSYFPNYSPRATYAAMISYLDEQVGDLIAQLKDLNLLDNTIIMFSSDNGPTFTGGADTKFFRSADPFQNEYGRTKGFVYEGGIRVPFIVSWKDRIKPGTSDLISAFQDIYPTICDLAGISRPSALDGISLVPTILSDGQQQVHEYLYWEFPSYSGQQAVRIGPWKGIRKNIFNGSMDIELYQLNSDPQERNNVAEQNQEVVSKIKEIMMEARTEPQIDRFKIENLGDIKQVHQQARVRAQAVSTYPLNLRDGYFTINRNTKLVLEPLGSNAVAILQERLLSTGGYLLQGVSSNKVSKNFIWIQKNNDLRQGKFQLDVTGVAIHLQCADQQGAMLGIQLLLDLMDEKINRDFEMHNPSWVISNLSTPLPTG